MKRLIRKLMILSLLVGALIFLTSPQRTRAEGDGPCDVSAISEA
jgi:hypothetical protein